MVRAVVPAAGLVVDLVAARAVVPAVECHILIAVL